MIDRSFKTLFVLALTACGAARAARADSDGYYCVGPNYIAYELQLAQHEHNHSLHVFRLNDSTGISARTTIVLPRFQVHGMRCEPDAIKLLGWDSLYTVSIAGPRPTVAVTVAPWVSTSRQRLPGFDDANLGAWSKPVRAYRSDTIPVQINATRYRFVLAIDVKPHPTSKCEFLVVTRLVQLDSNARAVQSVVLFDGDAPRECGN